ncbi:TetR/AcrR family transcriptional regulator [Micromonospora sp. NPDC002389]|uniref:TetR/AcrR family transcriptional regulator n=1 Tax=Micromonospora sp. NPDC002389 TaxID=3154272 RepID=UPI0033178EE5
MRSDAARNRETVLAVAGRLFDEATDPDQVSMDAVAAAAGVGKGTLFRGFGDRAGLVAALWRQRGEELVTALTTAEQGPGPLRDRVLALLYAAQQFKLRNRTLALSLEKAGRGSPYGTDDYERWHRVLTALVAAARGPADAPHLAHALLAAVRADLLIHLGDRPENELRSGLEALVDAIVTGPGSARAR